MINLGVKILKIEKSKCSGCHACVSRCPKNCIKMVHDDEGFLYPQIDKETCINCGLCEKVCPAIKETETLRGEKEISAYAAYIKDEAIRAKSSSGGLFTAFATAIIKKGGSRICR